MPAYQRIVFIGFRGTGKSTIAKLVADRLGWEYISTDRLIEKTNGNKISQLVEMHGWSEFRKMEKQVIQTLKDKMQAVIDLGGGAVEDEENMKHLKSSSLVVWLDALLDDIYERISREAAERPFLSHTDLRDDIEYNYLRRLPQYKKFGMVSFNSSKISTEEICQLILKEIGFTP